MPSRGGRADSSARIDVFFELSEYVLRTDLEVRLAGFHSNAGLVWGKGRGEGGGGGAWFRGVGQPR